MTRYAVGVDIGGTFTDFAIHDTLTDAITGLKCPTVPADPVQGLIDGLAILATERSIRPADIGTFVHGTTTAVNTLIQRNGARLGLLVTEGFRDLLEIQRLALHTVHSWKGARPTPLIPRQHVFEVRERLRANGTVHLPLDETGLPGIAATALAQQLDGLVICFLHAYRNPVHEHAVRDRLATLAPGLLIGCSSDIWPQLREYERAMISIINFYVTPKIGSYLSSLERRLAELGLAAVPYSTSSNGGLMTARSARNRPAETLLSGPAAGVTGAVRMASELGIADFVTLDIGGTSADVAFVEGGQATVSQSEHIAEFPIMMPVVVVSSIGAGGGSMIWLDGAGVLRIGPDSVGSDPGPDRRLPRRRLSRCCRIRWRPDHAPAGPGGNRARRHRRRAGRLARRGHRGYPEGRGGQPLRRAVKPGGATRRGHAGLYDVAVRRRRGAAGLPGCGRARHRQGRGTAIPENALCARRPIGGCRWRIRP